MAEGGFESALRLGVQRGEIVVLPEDFGARARAARH